MDCRMRVSNVGKLADYFELARVHYRTRLTFGVISRKPPPVTLQRIVHHSWPLLNKCKLVRNAFVRTSGLEHEAEGAIFIQYVCMRP